MNRSNYIELSREVRQWMKMIRRIFEEAKEWKRILNK